MLLLGIDLGTSSIKASVVDSQSRQTIASAVFPETEAEIISLQRGWAEQDPNTWWEHVQQAILNCHGKGNYHPKDIGSVGIAYQMHGLVVVDERHEVLRHSIIWCDSRAVPYGDKAFETIGEQRSLDHLLNSPGNFTASKLAWVKDHEPDIYSRISRIMLPGDFIALRMTGRATTSISALSEGVFWDFQHDEISKDILAHYGFSEEMIPPVQPVFSNHGEVLPEVAEKLGLRPGVAVGYKAGDQPNNALSLNVLEPGEIATTAGTSGVIYGVSDRLFYDKQSRINGFAHVNYTPIQKRIGVLLCINGAGIFNRWMKDHLGTKRSYAELNRLAEGIAPGSDGLFTLPFGNGAERMLNNQMVGAHFHNLDLNLHHTGHLIRAVQEGIVFSMRYGLDIMRENGMRPEVVRANKTNMFLSELFAQAFADVSNLVVEFYQGDGSYGAAIGGGYGAGAFSDLQEAFAGRKPTGIIEPAENSIYGSLYEEWKQVLKKHYCSGN